MNKTGQKITAIVCAYNEENTIRQVLNVLAESPLIHEVIAVDDGSQDRTGQIMNEFNRQDHVKTIPLSSNQGKGYAMAAAAEQASGDVLLFIDADLRNLTPNHISLLLEIFFRSEAKMIIGIPIRGESISVLERLDPFHKLSGQRVLYRKDFLPLLDPVRSSGYGVETILNTDFRQKGKLIESIYLPNLNHPIKVEKTSWSKAFSEYLLAGKQILLIRFSKPHWIWKSFFSIVSER